jgi:DnaK suppressor protein|tara:strand:- start:127 stop:600 length:474 start_codon:yes stop_codon:yes gene_type:complete
MIMKKAKNKFSNDLLTSFGIDKYKPKAREKYMSMKQLNHFEIILLTWKSQLEQEADKTVNHMKKESINYADPNDRASQESDFGLELRTRDRERKLLKKIQQSLHRIENGSYGYCEETGEEIGLKRLEARPVATLCLEAQERREITEKQYSDINDYLR